MNQVHSIVCGVPFCQKNKGKQTNLSIVLKMTAIVGGFIAIVAGAYIVIKGYELGHLAATYGWAILMFGIVLVVAGMSIKCIKTRDDSKKNVKPPAQSIPSENPKNNKNEEIPKPIINPATLSLPEYQIIQRKKIEGNLEAGLELEKKRKEQLEWFERTNKQKEKEYQDALVELNEKKFPDNETGKKIKQMEIEFLTTQYNNQKESRKRNLDNYLASLESTHKNAMQLAKILSGDKD